MSKKNRHYSAEFKAQALQLLDSSGQTASEIERDLGITQGLLSRWKRKLEAGTGSVNQVALATEVLSAEMQIKQLKRENAILCQERDILKKTVVIFGHNPRH